MLTKLLDSIEAAENPELELLERTIERAALSNPALADALRYCSIPRRFDADTIGVLRDAPDTPEEREKNEQLLKGVLHYNFVIPKPRGGYAYHDVTRDVLLHDWLRDEGKRPRFDELTARLVRHYEAAFERARELQQSLADLAVVLKGANEDRYLQIAAANEQLLVGELVEALYYEQLTSGPRVHAFLNRRSDQIQGDGRLASVVVTILGEYLNAKAQESGGESWFVWVSFWRARFLSRLGLQNAAEAERLLRDLLPSAEQNPELLSWVLSELGLALEAQDRLSDAHQIHNRELTLLVESGIDRWNLPSSHARVAALELKLDRLGSAASNYAKAKEGADQVQNLEMRIRTRVHLAYVQRLQGLWDEAFESGLEALDIARTEAADEAWLHREVAQLFMALFANHDGKLLDTMYVETVALLAMPPEARQRLVLQSEYVDLLREGGQLERATQQLKMLEEHPAAANDPSASVEVWFRAASVHDDLGHPEVAIDYYTRVIDAARNAGLAANWDYVAAVSNRGMEYIQVTQWSKAEADFEEAAQRWHEMGHQRLTGLLKVYQAEALGQQGRFEEAQALLDQARPILDTSDPSRHVSDYYHFQGHLYQRQGRWNDASAFFEQALQVVCSLRRGRDVGKVLIHLITAAARAGRWLDASTLADEAGATWSNLAVREGLERSGASKQANLDNARGMKAFVSSERDRQYGLARACELFQHAIKQDELVPGHNFWFQLNLSYAAAEVKNWKEASKALEVLLEHRPEWLPVTGIRARLAHYRLQHDRALAGRS